jgi:hypothetical protein
VKARAAATPIALLVLAVGAVSYAYFIDRATVSDADRAARRQDVFPTFRVDQVSRVEIDHGGVGFVIERDPDAGPGASLAWLLPGRREHADPVAVDTLLRELELATRLRDVAASAALGLDAPRARGTVKVGAVEYRFEIGVDAPRPEGGAYMRVDGEGAFVVGRSIKVQLLRGLDAYRDRALVGLGAGDVMRLDVRGADGGGGFGLERDGAGFRVVGTGMRASREAAGRVFSALADVRADRFLDDGVADRLSAAGITVTLSPQDANRPLLELRIGGACPEQPGDVVVVRMPERRRADGGPIPNPAPLGTFACTARALLDALGATTESLVDLAPLFAHADEIEQMRLEPLPPGGTRVELARKESGWRERAPEERDLDQDESDSANNLALALANARGLDARRGGPDDRLAARARVTVVRSGDGASEVVELGAPAADGTTLARRIDDGAILRLSRTVARRFEAHAVALRPRAIWLPAFDPGEVIAIDDGCVHAMERLELRDQTWTMRSPAGLPVDASSVTDLVGAIAHAKADAWIAERDDGGFGFDGPASCTIGLTIVGEAGRSSRRVGLVFGDEGDGGVYARALGDSAVFVVPKVLRELVSRPAVDRGRLRIDPTALTSVTLATGAGRLVLERSGERLVRPTRERDAQGDDDRLETALAGFYAQAALHTGAPTPDEGMDRPILEIRARGAEADGGAREIRIFVGGPGHIDADEVYFARVAGVDATFAVPGRAVNAILDAR